MYLALVISILLLIVGIVILKFEEDHPEICVPFIVIGMVVLSIFFILRSDAKCNTTKQLQSVEVLYKADSTKVLSFVQRSGTNGTKVIPKTDKEWYVPDSLYTYDSCSCSIGLKDGK